MSLNGPCLKRLQVYGLRNIERADLALDSRFCLLTGDNGSGKTSLLEAIWFLGTGRSFRSNRFRSVINYGVDRAVVHGQLSDPSGNDLSLGVARERSGHVEFKIDGVAVRATSALAEVLPVQLLNPESVSLVAGGPSERRRFLDWGTFHVEHGFFDAWKGYRRSLDQRNMLLRSERRPAAAEFKVWEQRLSSTAVELDGFRREYLERLRPRFGVMLAQLGMKVSVDVGYRSGWAVGAELVPEEILAETRDRDREVGFTRQGPHRADLRLTSSGRPIAESFSRGQQKVVASALLLAQGEVLAQSASRQAVYLVDDLPAELDSGFRRRLCKALVDLPAQVIVTATQPELVLDELSSNSNIDLFHVEQGQVRSL